MKVHVDVTTLSTTRREGGDNVLTMKPLSHEPNDNGNYEVEVAGPSRKVMGWLKRNGYEHGDYVVVES